MYFIFHDPQEIQKMVGNVLKESQRNQTDGPPGFLLPLLKSKGRLKEEWACGKLRARDVVGTSIPTNGKIS
jgi:hypothetical protein